MDVEEIIEAIFDLSADDLERVQRAIDKWRGAARAARQSAIVERRGYRGGVLQHETRAYVRKDGKATTRGPYWFYKIYIDGRPSTLYLGKTDDPESLADEKLEELRRARTGGYEWPQIDRMEMEHDEA